MRQGNFWNRLAVYMSLRDGRYEELRKGNITKNIFDDITAGFIVAAVAIPLAMGFAMASGLRPEQGIAGGAVAALLGAIFGGSKYQVYGPTAAFIPVIAALMATYDHGFLVLASIIAGVMLLVSGFLRLGHLIGKIPYSIIVGFSVGIAIIIICSQIGHAVGLKDKAGPSAISQLVFVIRNLDAISIAAIMMTLCTIIFCRAFESLFHSVPGPVPALVFGYLGGQTFWSNKGLVMIADEYGKIPTEFFTLTLPVLPTQWNAGIAFDLFYFSFTIFLIASIEGIMCGRAADRLAVNKGFPFSATRELRGQGILNIFSPLFNGFPHTGALGRTALNIRVKGRSPISVIAKSIITVLLAVFLASYLGQIPMACIGGILLYVASGMIKRREIRKVVHWNNYHVLLMYYTIIAVPLLGFTVGVLSALLIYGVYSRSFEKKRVKSMAGRNRWNHENN